MNNKILAILFVVALSSAGALSAQDQALQGRATPQVTASGQLAQKIAVSGAAAQCPAQKGVLSYGTPVIAYLGDEGSCFEGGSWVDVWTFYATVHADLRVTYTAASPSVAAIQDYATGTVLASSSGVCGDLARSCTFDYTVPHSGAYILGFGAPGSERYTLTVSLLRGGGAPPGANLIPYAPVGWSDRIVVSNVTGSHTDSPYLLPTEVLYVDWAVVNAGTTTPPLDARVAGLYLDGVLVKKWPSPYLLTPSEYCWVEDYPIGPLSAGMHTLELRADPDNEVAEIEEGDNEYTKTIVVGSQPTGACIGTATTLCLNAGRFAASVDWTTADGRSGQGRAIRLTDDSGYFWFFDSNNIELCVKVLDGSAVNGHFWVFYGSLSNVKFTMTVTDTRPPGSAKTYVNPQGTMASVADILAF